MSAPTSGQSVEREMGRKTRRSLLVGGAATLAGAGAWEWLRSRRPEGGISWPLRQALNTNEQLSRDYFRDTRLTRTFPLSAVETGRVNGDIGLDDDLDPAWKLTVTGLGEPLSLALDQIKALPKVEMITQLKCIEGWSRVLQWSGCRFKDFVAKHVGQAAGQASAQAPDPDSYVAFETPDREYYTGLDLASAMHRQTLLCYEMNGKPLTPEHGAPLRLVIPVKYGIKNIKRLGTIAFSPTRPRDYWAERGYDWYAGF